jgi:hypothetical protein
MEAPQKPTKKMLLIGQEKFYISEVNVKLIPELHITKEKSSNVI